MLVNENIDLKSYLELINELHNLELSEETINSLLNKGIELHTNLESLQIKGMAGYAITLSYKTKNLLIETRYHVYYKKVNLRIYTFSNESKKQQYINLKENTLYYCLEVDSSTSKYLFEEIEINPDKIKTFLELSDLLKTNSSLVCFKNIEHFENYFKSDLLTKTDEYFGVDFDGECYFKILDIFKKDSNFIIRESEIDNTVKHNLKKNYYLNYISAVLEIKNNRYFFFVTSSYYSYQGIHIYFYKTDYTKDIYNYIDAGRYFIYNSKRLDTFKIKHFFLDIPADLPDTEALNYMLDSADIKNQFLIDNDTIKLYTKKYTMIQLEEKQKKEQEEHLSKKIKFKINQLNTEGNTLVINDITFYPKKIEYENQVLEIKNEETFWVRDLLLNLINYKKFDEIIFDDVLELFAKKITYKTKAEITIGKLNINVEFNNKINKAGVYSTRAYINKYRVNISEVEECLKTALCFNKIEDYNAYLKNVSSCSLKLHNYLHNGIKIKISTDTLFDYGLIILIKLIRKSNKYFVVINNKEYKVKDTNKLINLEKEYNLLSLINKLMKGDIIYDLDEEAIKKIISEGKIRYEEILRKEKELLEQTEKLFNLQKQQNIILQNNKTIEEGYIIKGKLRTYCVDLKDSNVYSYPDGHYLCIIDKSVSKQKRNKIIDRIYALHNDNLVAEQIYTLTDGI